jgi:hypothetical protein
MPSSTSHRHPSVGVNDTLKRYFKTKMSKQMQKRRELNQMSQQQAIERFAELQQAAGRSSYSAPRNHSLTKLVAVAVKGAKDDKKEATAAVLEIKGEVKSNVDAVDASQEVTLAKESNSQQGQSSSQSDNNKTSAKETSIATKPKKEPSTQRIDLTREDLASLEQEEQILEATNRRIQQAKEGVHQDLVELWGVYRYGLQHVLGLNDLASAPDAILPGNFPET